MQPSHLPLPLALALIALLAPACSNSSAESVQAKPASMPPPAVTVAPVEFRDLAETTEFSGRLGAVDDVEIRPRVSGHVDAVHFQSGQLVKKGDPLFTIDARWYEATLASTEAVVVEARVMAENADREAARSAQLLESRAISAEESESRTAKQARAKASLLAAEAARDAAKLDVEYTRIVAPVAGRISRALVTPGNFVSGLPAANTLLTTIVSVDPMYVYVDVDENTLLRIQRLMQAGSLPHDDQGRVKVEVGLADEDGFPRAGVVESLGNRLDMGTGSIVMRVLVSNPDGLLLPGLFARVRMPTSPRRPTAVVSLRAIGTDQSQKFVYVVGKDDTAQRRTVELGPVVEGMRTVRSGLEEGERVIVNGTQRIFVPGSPVTPELEKPQAATASGS